MKRNSINELPIYNKISVSKIYQNVNSNNKDHNNFDEILFGDIEKYELIKHIGSGKYSTVFLGINSNNEYYAIKILKCIPINKIYREIQILKHLINIPNVIRIYDTIKDNDSKTISIITEYQESVPFRILFPSLNIEDIRFLMYNLLICLDNCHKLGVMHRDIKPGNILISSNKKQLRLIDWGLSDFYYPETAYSVRVSTLRYKAPELLLNYQYYDYSVDIWSAGCVFAEMLCKYPFFDGRTIDEMILNLANLCGTNDLLKYIEKFGLILNDNLINQFSNNLNQNNWFKIFSIVRNSKKDESAFNLLKLMLTIDHENRITANEALKHPFFDSLKPPTFQ